MMSEKMGETLRIFQDMKMATYLLYLIWSPEKSLPLKYFILCTKGTIKL